MEQLETSEEFQINTYIENSFTVTLFLSQFKASRNSQ